MGRGPLAAGHTADKVNVAYLRAMTRLVATVSGLLAVSEPGPSSG